MSNYEKESIERHKKAIEVYVDDFRRSNSKQFKILTSKGIEKDILRDHFVHKKTIRQIASEYGVSTGTVSSFITDYQLANYVDGNVEEAAILDAENHLGVMTLFFANAMYLSKEAALNSLMARKLREEIAQSMSTRGAIETAKDRDLMNAWGEISRKTIDYSSNASKYMDTYLKLMEKVLDKQRDLAFVKVLYDIIQKLDPTVAEKLNDALMEDDYAKAVLASMSGEALLKVFTARAKGQLTSNPSYVDDILLNDEE